jgi:hypothetical protein
MPERRIFSGIVLVAIFLAACSPTGGGGDSPAQPAQPAAATESGPVIVVTSTPTPSAQVPANIPIMPGATELKVSESDISYVVKSDLQSVIDFYEKEMLAKGWKEQEKPSIIADFGRMNFDRSDRQVSLLLNASPSLNQVVIRMSLIYLNVVEKTATPKP